jgi:alpha-L-rhamnosidase
MHRVIGGIAPLEPGYAKVLVAPQPGGGIRWARSSLETRRGTISVSWSREGADDMRLDLSVPDGVTALVRRPGHPDLELGGGQHSL